MNETASSNGGCSSPWKTEPAARKVDRNAGSGDRRFSAKARAVSGSSPFFLGLAIVLPVLRHATWHLYRRIVPAA